MFRGWAKFVFSLFSCLSGTDNTQHSNEIDLFDAIDKEVSLAHSYDIRLGCTMSIFCYKFYFLSSGVQTQAHRPVSLVLFTESSVREIMAKINKREGKGK